MIYVMCGLPRSGKSTASIDILKEIGNQFTVLVNGDTIRLAITGQRYNPLVEDYVSSIKHTMIKSHALSGMDVIVDGTHTTVSSVRKLENAIIDVQNLLDEEVPIGFVFIDTPPEVCIERAVKSNQSDLIPVIENMSKQRPESVEYIKNKYTKKVIIHGENTVYEVFTI